MLLRITITYFSGAARDVLNYHGLTLEQASAHKDRFLKAVQDSVERGLTFYVSGDGGDQGSMCAFGPDLLRSAHFRLDIVDE